MWILFPIFAKPKKIWRLYGGLSFLNFAVFFFEIIFCACTYRKDKSKIFLYGCLGCLLSSTMIYQLILWCSRSQVLGTLRWCESRHGVRHPKINHNSKWVFQDALEFGLNLIEKRMKITLGITCFALVLGGLGKSICKSRFHHNISNTFTVF